jgi:hypothetical protein
MKLNAVATFVLLWGSIMSVTGNSVAATRRVAEKTAIEKVIHDSICWALTKDRDLQESTMAHDEEITCYPTCVDSRTGFGLQFHRSSVQNIRFTEVEETEAIRGPHFQLILASDLVEVELI